ncbi:MAG: threonylcarbamoyl-AMP synthase [Candidatus Marinimicrobia bacterium]|nr:threonylcarbamoyl-AMP synthase [Candidatus Neomarinimicrobiota bacterium]
MIHPVSETTFNNNDVQIAVNHLQNNNVIVYPTDTLYGLGCDVFSKKAVNRIYKIKILSKRKPLSIICSDFTQLSEFATVPNSSYRLMKDLFPGPFTCILNATNKVPKLLISKQRTVGIRIPDSPFILEVVKKLGNPIITTSLTNIDDNYITEPTELYHQYKNQIDILFSSSTSKTKPSTVIDLTRNEPIVIRDGLGEI